MPTYHDGASNLNGSTNLAAADKMRQKSNAGLTVRGKVVGSGYSAAQLAALIAVLETETDATARRDVLSRLVAYYAAGEADSSQDRSTVAHILERQFKDADLLLRHLYGFFGPAGLGIDRPTAELLFEFESLVAAKRIAAGLPKLPGSSF
jgi:hypothetical protein